MKISYILIISIIFYFTSTTITTAQDNIPWTKETKLKWTDFKAEPDTRIMAYASTSYSIEIQPKEVLVDQNNNIKNYKSLSVIAFFNTNLSWVFKKDDYLLKHEQLHFDIAALYAFKMKEEFQKLKKNNISNFDAYTRVYDRLWAECRAFQKKYDKATNHGILKDINDEWIAEVTSLLDSQK